MLQIHVITNSVLRERAAPHRRRQPMKMRNVSNCYILNVMEKPTHPETS